MVDMMNRAPLVLELKDVGIGVYSIQKELSYSGDRILFLADR
jgi:hypothetical protein